LEKTHEIPQIISSTKDRKSSLVQSPVLKRIELHNRRYLGNKTKLTSWIFDKILQATKGECTSFFDVFAGTGAVSKVAFQHFNRVIVNDFLHANHNIFQAFFAKGRFSEKRILDLLNFYNRLNVSELEPNYFSEQFGDKFFDLENAKRIGFIREDLESRRGDLSPKEFAIVLTALIYGMDKIANTVGHYDAYIKKPIRPRRLQLNLPAAKSLNAAKIYRENANDLVKKVKADVVYIDPPYNSRQYNRFYHIYENLVQWKKPELFGVAMKPKAENSSVYCTVKAKDAFADLIENLDAKHIFVSYNNTYKSKSGSSRNKIQLEEIREILESRGEVTMYEKGHRYFSAGKTDFVGHKEVLFGVRVL
jgi:adenine-specific DNA-methyltransferase